MKPDWRNEHGFPGETGARFSPGRCYRYLLWRLWDRDRLPLLVIGLNPSTADETEDDPTIRRCIRYARDWGHGGLLMANIFAYRATAPADMKAQPSPVAHDWHEHGIDSNANNLAILEAASSSALTLCAWGTHGAHRNRDRAVLRLFDEVRHPVYCLDTTKAGFPRHPLYCKADLKPVLYEGRPS